VQNVTHVDVNELLKTAARAAAVYVLMLLVIRALGRRTVGNVSAFDLLVALMLGEIVDEMIYGDVRFIQGTVAMVVIGGLAYADSLLCYWDRGMEAILEGKPTLVALRGGASIPVERDASTRVSRRPASALRRGTGAAWRL
jgi:uncharacterized membrane protein YcaP (DUF421 family)